MLAVAAYPIIYAFWLSLNKADLRQPNANEFIGFDNYVTVLSSPIWWQAFGVTMFITVVSASLELVLGMLLAIVMHRTIVGRGLVRTSALVPYGDRHRGRRVLLAVRLDRGPRLPDARAGPHR